MRSEGRFDQKLFDEYNGVWHSHAATPPATAMPPLRPTPCCQSAASHARHGTTRHVRDTSVTCLWHMSAGALVQLADEQLQELYGSFMQIYVEEASDEVFARLGISNDPDDATLGFAEMMTIKLGELIDQPRRLRIQAFEAQQRRKLQQEEDRERKQATMRQAMAKASARAAPELSWSLP